MRDLTGMVFGRLRVLPLYKTKPTMWACRCECGNTRYVYAANMKRGIAKSCGCLQKELATTTSTSFTKDPAMTVKTKPATAEYRDGYDRIFSKPQPKVRKPDFETEFIEAWNADKVRRVSDGKRPSEFEKETK